NEISNVNNQDSLHNLTTRLIGKRTLCDTFISTYNRVCYAVDQPHIKFADCRNGYCNVTTRRCMVEADMVKADVKVAVCAGFGVSLVTRCIGEICDVLRV
ncbi:MAG: hypothetical protein LBQ66_06360, partial [Planctomycetaceae bacterium]|nr:hypothetical protein [Planctomycetaceae bacterium]